MKILESKATGKSIAKVQYCQNKSSYLLNQFSVMGFVDLSSLT